MTEEKSTALALAPGADVEVMSYYDEAQKLQQYAEARVITTIEGVKLATDDLSIISKLKKALEEKRKQYISPLQDQVKQINETYKTFMVPIDIADRTTRDKILAYQRWQEHIRQEQEEINRKRQDAAEAEMKLKGELSESVNLVEVVPEAPKRVSTDMGTVGQRDNWKWEVTDFSLIPDEFKMINSGVITPVVKASKGKIIIPGVRIYNEPIIAVNVK